MILNMHIRNDFRLWGLGDEKQRVRTLCKKITTPRYAGVPGIEPGQQPFVSEDRQDYAWCLDCCHKYVSEVAGLMSRVGDERLRALYFDGLTNIVRQLQMANGTTSLK
jgi:hypothetical protein